MGNQWRTVNFAARYRVPFQTTEALDEYLAGVDQGERIACLVCGRAFRNVGIHARRSHGLSARAYCGEFGIPLTIGLVSPKAVEAYSCAASTRFETEPSLRAALEAGREHLRTLNVPGCERPAHAAVSKQRHSRRSKAMWNDQDRKAKLVSALHSQEAVAKRNLTNSTAETKAKRVAAAKTYWETPGAKLAAGARARGRSASPLLKRMRSEWMKAFWSDPIRSADRCAKMRERWDTPARRAEAVAVLKEHASRPKRKAQASATMKRLHAQPEFKSALSARASARMKRLNADPDFQAKARKGRWE